MTPEELKKKYNQKTVEDGWDPSTWNGLTVSTKEEKDALYQDHVKDMSYVGPNGERYVGYGGSITPVEGGPLGSNSVLYTNNVDYLGNVYPDVYHNQEELREIQAGDSGIRAVSLGDTYARSEEIVAELAATDDPVRRQELLDELNGYTMNNDNPIIGSYTTGEDGRGYIPVRSGSEEEIGAGYTGSKDNLSDYIREMNEAAKAKSLAEFEAAYKKAVASIDNAEFGLKGQYQDARNQTAGASEQQARNFNEFANARGLNTGAAGQAELARSVTLRNNLNDINTAEADALSDLDLQRAQAKTDYEYAIAWAEAQGDYELASALYQESVRVQEQLLAQQQYQDSLALQQQQLAMQQQAQDWSQNFQQSQFDYQQQQAQKDLLAGYGWNFLQNGVPPTEGMLEAMGLDAAAAQSFISAIQAKKVEGTAMSFATAKQAAAAGVFNDQVLAILRENGYTDDMLSAIYGYKSPQVDSEWAAQMSGLKNQQLTGQLGTTPTPESIMDMMGWQPAVQSGTAAQGGTIDGKSVAEYDAAAGNYTAVKTAAGEMKANGASTAEILAFLKEAQQSGALNTGDYMSLYNTFRG